MHLGVRLSIGRLFGQKLTSELRPFFTSYLGHIVLAFTNALLYVTGISFLQNHFVSLTLRPGGAYVFRPDTFLVCISKSMSSFSELLKTIWWLNIAIYQWNLNSSTNSKDFPIICYRFPNILKILNSTTVKRG